MIDQGLNLTTGMQIPYLNRAVCNHTYSWVNRRTWIAKHSFTRTLWSGEEDVVRRTDSKHSSTVSFSDMCTVQRVRFVKLSFSRVWGDDPTVKRELDVKKKERRCVCHIPIRVVCGCSCRATSQTWENVLFPIPSVYGWWGRRRRIRFRKIPMRSPCVNLSIKNSVFTQAWKQAIFWSFNNQSLNCNNRLLKSKTLTHGELK